MKKGRGHKISEGVLPPGGEKKGHKITKVGVYKSPTPPVLSFSLQTRREKDLPYMSVSFDSCIKYVYL